MPRLWDITTEKGKENLIKKAQELGMLHYNPDAGHKKPYVKIQGKLEGIEEIDRLIREKPGFENDRKVATLPQIISGQRKSGILLEPFTGRTINRLNSLPID